VIPDHVVVLVDKAVVAEGPLNAVFSDGLPDVGAVFWINGQRYACDRWRLTRDAVRVLAVPLPGRDGGLFDLGRKYEIEELVRRNGRLESRCRVVRVVALDGALLSIQTETGPEIVNALSSRFVRARELTRRLTPEDLSARAERDDTALGR